MQAISTGKIQSQKNSFPLLGKFGVGFGAIHDGRCAAFFVLFCESFFAGCLLAGARVSYDRPQLPSSSDPAPRPPYSPKVTKAGGELETKRLVCMM